MDRKDFESLLNNYPDCVSDGKKLKAFLKDLYPDVPKAIVNTLTIMADDGIISEMQMSTASSSLVSARLQKKLEDDYGLSQKIIAECFSLIIYDSAKQPQTTNNARSHENINVSTHTTSKSASKKENFPKNTTKSGEKPLSQSIPAKGKTTKQTNTNFAFDPKDFKIENGTLKKYKGNSSVVVIPDSVTRIGAAAFEDCSGLTSITIPNRVTSIGAAAFKDCSGLTSITIPNRVTSIGDSAFSGCTGHTSIIVDEGNTKYHSAGNCLIETATKTLILGCKTSVIPTDGSVTSIGDYAFKGCTGFTSITIPNSVTSIGDKAFEGCTGLTSITIPNSVTSIGAAAFKDCSGLTSITIPNRVTSIGDCAFYKCTGLTSITIPDSVTSIGNNAFDGCKLQDIYITDIGAWCNISGLIHLMGYGSSNKRLYINNELATSITIPNGATVIPGYAFKGCSSLTSITIPDSVMSIRDYAFLDCTGLTSITIPNSVTSIGKSAFSGCAGLTSITIPDSVTSIGESAFKNCIGLISIGIPSNVTRIGGKVFRGCKKTLVINCEAESKPIEWSSYWNSGNRPVVWGVKDKT